MLKGTTSESNISENGFNRRLNPEKLDPAAQFAPWEAEDTMDYTSSHYITLLGFKTAQERPQVPYSKTTSFINHFPDIEAYTQGMTRASRCDADTNEENNKKDSKKDSRKKLIQAKETDKKQKRPASFRPPTASNRLQTDADITRANQNINQITLSNQSTHRNQDAFKHNRKIKKFNQPNQEGKLLLDEIRNMESVNKEQEGSLGPKFNDQITRIFETKRASHPTTTNLFELNQNKWTPEVGEESFRNLEAFSSTRVLEPRKEEEQPMDPLGGSYGFFQEDKEAMINRLRFSGLSSGSNIKVRQDLHLIRAEGIKIPIQGNSPVDAKSFMVEDDTTEYVNSPGSVFKGDLKLRKVQSKREQIPLRLSTAVISSKRLNGNKLLVKKSKTLPSNQQSKQLIQLEDEKKEDNVLIDKPSYPQSQTLRPTTAKQTGGGRWFGKTTRPEEEMVQNSYIPTMLEYYKKNKKKYFRSPGPNMTQIPSELEDYYKVSQIPLLGNLKKAMDLKSKGGTRSSIVIKSQGLNKDNLSPSPERLMQYFLTATSVTTESILIDKDTNLNSSKSLQQKGSRFAQTNSNIVTKIGTHGITKSSKERPSITPYAMFPQKPPRPSTAAHIFRGFK